MESLLTVPGDVSKYTGDSTGPDVFENFAIKAPNFSLIIESFTRNTCVMVVLPPGEAELNCAKINIKVASERLATMIKSRGQGREKGHVEEKAEA